MRRLPFTAQEWQQIEAWVLQGCARHWIARQLGVTEGVLTSRAAAAKVRLRIHSAGSSLAGRKARRTRERMISETTGLSEGERMLLQRRRRRIRMIASRAKNKASIAELQAVVARSHVEVTKCPPGTHAGWLPSYLR